MKDPRHPSDEPDEQDRGRLRKGQGERHERCPRCGFADCRAPRLTLSRAAAEGSPRCRSGRVRGRRRPTGRDGAPRPAKSRASSLRYRHRHRRRRRVPPACCRRASGPRRTARGWRGPGSARALTCPAAPRPRRRSPLQSPRTPRSDTYDYLVNLRNRMREHIDTGGDIIGSVEVDQSFFALLISAEN